MTWSLWLLAATAGLAMFGLGCVAARASLKHRGHDRMLGEDKANTILAIFFTVIAISVAVDTVHLQVTLNRHIAGQSDCETRLIAAQLAISQGRRAVDEAAANYDVALAAWLAVSARQPVIPADDPVSISLREMVSNVTAARLAMLQIYADHPLVACR